MIQGCCFSSSLASTSRNRISSKAAGHDGLSAEHFKFAHRKLDILLSLLITVLYVTIICHSF